MIEMRGLFSPITVPFDDLEEVSYAALEENLEKWMQQDMEGIIVPGSNSEAVHLSWEEKLQIWKTSLKVVHSHDRKVIAGVGGQSTREAVHMLKAVGEIGAVAALMLPPYYYKKAMSHVVLRDHFMEAADQSPVPILIYNMPANTGVDIPLETMLDLALHPKIIGLKESSSNVLKTAQLIAKRPDFQVLAGTATALLPFLSLGAVGGVMAMANFGMQPLRELYTAFNNGNLAEARKIQLSVAEINTAVTSLYGIPALKYCMDRCGFYGGSPRRPLRPVSKKIQKELDMMLSALQLNNVQSDV